MRARSASAGSTVVAVRLRRAPPSRAAFSAARTVRPSCGDLPRQAPARVVVRQRQHGPGVALGEVAAGEHPEHVLGKLEQADAVRDRRLRAADPLGDLAERELELVDQRRVGARLFDRRQVLAGDVLDESEQQRVAVVGVPHDRGDRRHARLAGRTPAALAGDRARSRPRAADARRPAAARPGAGSRPRGPRSPRARSGAAAGAGSRGPPRPAGAAARPRRLRRSAPRGRGRGRGAVCH